MPKKAAIIWLPLQVSSEDGDKQEKISCEVLVYDLEDGILSAEQITWTDKDGRILGKGQRCLMPASEEQVFVVAVDAKGNRVKKGISISK